MKKIFISIFCFLSFQIVKAYPLVISSTEYFFHQTKPSTDNYGKIDTVIVPVINQPAPLSNQNSSIFKLRLDSIKKDVPLDYNEYVQSYIDIYSRNHEEMGRVLGLTKYYFPIYEKAFRDAGIPDEIKYLSIVESKLDPFAVSRVGATGPWQFMFSTAKLYRLNINDYVDERRDPIQASYAAAAYLKDAYEEFGDWLLAIAAYNCGSSNIERAIEKAGSTDFWTIRKFLPEETRNYVPAYIAITYIMNYYGAHNIIPRECGFSLKTDTVLVNRYVSLSMVSKALNVDLKELCVLNPAYKRQIVNGTDSIPRRLVIPQVDQEKYSALFDVINNNDSVAESHSKHAVRSEENDRFGKIPSFHRVKRGETLAEIANSYGVELEKLKFWNHLHRNKAVIGQKLKLSEDVALNDETRTLKRHHTYITYKVKDGDTLSGIAAKFDGASVEKIKLLNKLKKSRIQPGMTIKI